MSAIPEILTTAFVVAIGVFAWWSLRPPKARRDDRSRNLGGNHFEPKE